MWTVAHTELTPASTSQLWARYADPTRWPEWDHGIRRVTMQAPMAVGARGAIWPVKGPPAPMIFTEVTTGVGFTTVTRLPLGRLTFTHDVAQTASGSRFTHQVTISGLLAPLYARVVGRGIAAGLPTAMQTLARLARSSIPIPSEHR